MSAPLRSFGGFPLAYFSFDYFDDSIWFSLVIFAIGIGIVVGATLLGRTRDSAEIETAAVPELS